MTDQCVYYPPTPAVPYRAPRLVPVPNNGWTAGANSHATHAGDAELVLKMGQVIGVVVGLTNDRATPNNPARISHGLSFASSPAGGAEFSIVEASIVKSSARPYTPNVTVFRIKRIGASVTYWQDGVLLASSSVPLAGTISAGAALYSASDGVL